MSTEQISIYHKNKPRHVSNILLHVFLIIVSVLYLAPLAWILLVSLKTNAELQSHPFSIPQVFQWNNYSYAWTKGLLGNALFNSVKVSGITLILSMIIGSMAAFGLSRLKNKIADGLMVYFLIGMMVPVHVILIPLFVVFSKLHMTNTTFGLLLPYITFALPLTIYIMTGFFSSIPGELFESATIDGCSPWKIFWSIAFPVARTGLFVTGLMTFVNTWNELLMAMVFISDKLKKTLPVSLTYFVGPYETNYVKMFAAIVIAVLPTIVVYCCFADQIVDGLTQGAVKG
ncbi:MAG: carbohydrate ABC transporter permease [Treponemataceae bacterium]|nr:carbohydrate ABC transporter permease [Treponemataceae bacterium]